MEYLFSLSGDHAVGFLSAANQSIFKDNIVEMQYLFYLCIVALVCFSVEAFRLPSFSLRSRVAEKLTLSASITDGVEFDTIAREWRLKWSSDNNKESLSQVQKRLDELKSSIQSVPGLKSIQRIVCGGCLDYKVVVSVDANKFGEWVSSSQLKSIV